MDDLVLLKVVSGFVIQVVEADYSNVGLSDSSVIRIRSILYAKVCFLVLVDENLRRLEEYLCSIWILMSADCIPEAAV